MTSLVNSDMKVSTEKVFFIHDFIFTPDDVAELEIV
jgi:hypothetical protein